jgi:hypothetical protein
VSPQRHPLAGIDRQHHDGGVHGRVRARGRPFTLPRDDRIVRIEQQLRKIARIYRRAAAKAGQHALDRQLRSPCAIAVAAGPVREHQAPVAALPLDGEAILVARARADAAALRDLHLEGLHRLPPGGRESPAAS